MKVIQLVPELNAGGVERGTLEIGRFLAANGHTSIVVSGGGRMVSQLLDEGSRHIGLTVGRKRLGSLRLVPRLRRLFKQERPDIVHVRSRFPAWLTWLAWRKMDPTTRPRLISTVHGFYSVNAYSKIMTCGERVICVSESVRDYVLKNYPSVNTEKLTVIHRGVDTSEYPYGYRPSPEWLDRWIAENPRVKDRYVVTLPGRITRWKGQLDFLEVIRLLRKRKVAAHGLIVGEPHRHKHAFFAEVQHAVEVTGLDPHITFLGHRSDLREVMAVSDVVVSCSTDPEAFGRVTLEALSLGRPVAGYDHGGVHEQLTALLPDGLIPVGDIQSMADRLAEWVSEPVLPQTKNPFTLLQMQRSVIEVYQSMN